MLRREFLALSGAAAAAPDSGDGAVDWEGASLRFTLDPPVSGWRRSGAGEFSGGGYRLRFESSGGEGERRVEFSLRREDGAEFTVRGYSVRAAVNFTGIYRVWNYRSGPLELMAEVDAYTRGLGGLDAVTAANSGIPLVVATDREGRTKFALGMLDQVETTRLKGEQFNELGLGRAEGLNFAFEFSKPGDYALRRRELRDGWFLAGAGRSWFETIERYTRWAQDRGGIRPLAPPAAAYAPVWNTWYPYGQKVDDGIIRENARICRKLGIANICIDAGYQNALTGGMSNAEEIRLFNDHTGDWTADPGKFPDFRGLAAHLHDQGQLLTVWVALFMAGKATRAYPKVRGMLMRDAKGNERDHLCPRHPATAGYLAETFGGIVRAYDLDGFWLDFMDGMHQRCHADHPHSTESPGEGYNRCLAAVRDAVLAHKRDFLMETRMKMSNLNVKAFANVLETTDMPFDFDLNRAMGVYVRAFGEGSAAKIDPAQWHVKESPANVAKSCATVVACGTPVFGVDFRRLPEAHLRVVEAWMRFYGEHREGLRRGRLEPASFERLFPQLTVAAGGVQMVYVGSTATAPVEVRASRLFVINASDSERVVLRIDGAQGRWRAVTRDCFLEKAGEKELVSLALDERIPQGGMLELEKI